MARPFEALPQKAPNEKTRGVGFCHRKAHVVMRTAEDVVLSFKLSKHNPPLRCSYEMV